MPRAKLLPGFSGLRSREFHQLGLPRFELGEMIQGFIECEQPVIGRARGTFVSRTIQSFTFSTQNLTLLHSTDVIATTPFGCESRCKPMSISEQHLDPVGRGGRVFASTHWSLVLLARRDDTVRAEPALAELCRNYWYPLYVYV